MKPICIKHFRALLTLLLLAAAAGGNGAWAQDFTIEASHNSSTHKTTFKIKRSGDYLPQQTVNFRTVNLSAYAGEHYTAVSGTYTFPANDTIKTVEVTESAASTEAYKYQNGTTRSYRFEVLDVNGFELAHYDRSMTTGTQFSNAKVSKEITDLVYFNGTSYASGLSSSKYLDVSFTPPSGWTNSDGYVNIDDEWNYGQRPAVVSTNSLINTTNATRTYLDAMGVKVYATVCFTMKEVNDGYQYVQIIEGNASAAYDGTDPNPSNNPTNYVNLPSNSLYKTCFELYQPGSSAYNSPGKQFFPHRYDYHNRTGGSQSADHTEFYLADGYMYQQRFKSSSYRASNSGSVVISPTVENITTRFDCAGGGNDTWGYKDFFVRMALCDATKPKFLNNSTAGITVSAGPYVKGNTFYISVPFSEIVHISSEPKSLITSWGRVYYESGDYTNVITFKGTINANAGEVLAITSIDGCLFNDLAGNYANFSSTSFNKTFTGITCTDTYTLAATNTSFSGLTGDYMVSDGTILPQPSPTVYFYKGIVNNSNRVTLTRNTHYTLSWSNNTAAGNGTVTATGTGSYIGSASTTFPIRWSTYTLRFHGNGSVGIPATGTMSDQSFQYGVAQEITANAFVREGFTFTGWNTQPDGSGTAYSIEQSVTGLTPDDGAVIDLYAQWAVIPWEGNGDDADHPYIILYASQLDSLAATVNSGTTYQYKFFKLGDDITYGTTGLGANESNYTAIGTESHHFRGTFDGDGKTVSGIRIYRPNDDYQGLFGYYESYTVKNIILANSIIVGEKRVGGIAGYKLYGAVTNCRVESDVTISGDDNYHGGIVGYQYKGTVSGCVSAASVNGLWYCGGIAGICEFTTLKDCLYTGTVANDSWKGAITGKNNTSTLTNNYYTSGGSGGVNASDCDGARRARTVILNEHVALVGEDTAYSVSGLTAIGTGNYALSYNDGTTTTLYSGEGQSLTLTYSDMPATGYVWNGFSATAGTLTGNTLTLSAADVTVSASTRDVWGVTNTPAADGSEAHPYMISDTTGLNLLARYVNGTDGYTANNFEGKFFKLANNITYSYEGLSATESNYTAIGGYFNGGNRYFRGTFDGDGDTISGIRIYKDGTTDDDGSQGLFGRVSGGTIKNLTLTDAVITGQQYVGGIAGYISMNNSTGGIIDNCHVTASVTLHAVADYARWHGGIVGDFSGDTLSGCTSAATLSYASGLTGCTAYGGLAGYLKGHLQNCLVVGATVSGTDMVGAVVGYKQFDYTDNANYYRGCTVNGSANATNVGVGGESDNDTPHDRDGIRSLHTLILGDGITVSSASETKTIGSTTYYASTSTVTLGFGGTPPAGQRFDTYKTIHGDDTTTLTGNQFDMPNVDLEVGVNFVIDTYNVTYDLNGETMQALANPTQYTIESEDFTLENPMRMGYVFAGWTGTGLTEPTMRVTVPQGSWGPRSYTATWTDVWNITGGADGSEEHPYLITDTAGLTLLATLTSRFVNDYSGQFFRLDDDIAYDHSTDWDDATSTEHNFDGIGTIEHPFRGTFDGQGHTVSGLRIYNLSDHQGLFGEVQGTVRNVTVSDSRFAGRYKVGGVVGDLQYGTVEDCQATSTVDIYATCSGVTNLGGIVGCMTNATVRGCTSAATITAAAGFTGCDYFGGVVGYLANNCTLADNLADGATVGGALHMGAIVGGVIVDDYNFDTNYYHHCTVGGNSTANIGCGLFGDMARGDIAENDGVVPAYSLTLGEHIAAAPEASLTRQGTGYYAVGRTLTLAAEGYTLDAAGYTVKDEQDNDVPLTGGDTFEMPASDVTVTATLTVTPWTGSGTAGDPYVIRYVSQLDLLAANVNAGHPYTDTLFSLGADIHYRHTTAWDDSTSTEHNYNAIGTSEHPFYGTFDGDGHMVSGLRIYTVNNYQGLFGLVQGTVRNVTVSDSRIAGGKHVGGIVGELLSGTVEHCHATSTVVVHAVIHEAKNHGGVVGWLASGTIRGCTGAAALTVAEGLQGCNYYGGIVGFNDYVSTVEHCLALGVTVDNAMDHGAITGRTNNCCNAFSNNYYYGCSLGGWTHNIGTSDGDLSMGAGAMEGNENTDLGYWWGDGTGAENNPYLITTPFQLDLLSTLTRCGFTGTGKHFHLGADIEYNPDRLDHDGCNYTATDYFHGTFDGVGHTISGIRIRKDGHNSANNYQGLFGRLADGAVRNVTLADAVIVGNSFVGGIVGYSTGATTIENCLVTGTFVGGYSYTGVIAGVDGYNGYDYHHNYYLNSSANGREADAGIGEALYAEDLWGDNGEPKACGVYRLLLPTDVTATPKTLTYDGDDYYVSRSTVTLGTTYDEGYAVTSADYNILNDGNNFNITPQAGIYSFSMPAADAHVSATVTDVWNITGGADGSEEHPYLITSPAGLNLLSMKVNAGHPYTDTLFSLGDNIAYHHSTPWDAVGGAIENNFNPIGCYVRDGDQRAARPFDGTFNGQGYTVGGLRIDRSVTTGHYADEALGLFGIVGENAKVKNVTLTDSRIMGHTELGGIAGKIQEGEIRDCHVTDSVRILATMNASRAFGGVVGCMDGGIVGECTSSATVSSNGHTDCARFGAVAGSTDNSFIVGCLATGALVECTDTVGAIAGYFPNDDNLIFNYYHQCTVGGNTAGIGTSNGDVDFNSGAVPAYSLTLSEHLTPMPHNTRGLSYRGIYYYQAGSSLTLELDRTHEEGYVIAAASYDDGTSHTLTPEDATYGFLMPAADVTVTATVLDVWNMGGGAEGTEAHPYLITSPAGLDLLARKVNAGHPYTDTLFSLGADISYTPTTAWNDASSTENNYTAIGGVISRNGGNSVTIRYFRGIFDGAGYTVRGIRIYRCGTVDASYNDVDDCQGLFGSIIDGTVKNVTLSDARITGRKHVGGLVGWLKKDYTGGIISNCHATDSVAIHAVRNDATNHGGIVGCVSIENNPNNLNTPVTLGGCTSSATLTAANGLTGCDSYGGIAGSIIDCRVKHCLALGATVGGTDKVGAIVGYTSGSNLSQNYYHGCTVGGQADATGVGLGFEQYSGSDTPHDLETQAGAMPAYTVAPGTAVTLAPVAAADTAYSYDGVEVYTGALRHGGTLYTTTGDATLGLSLAYTGTSHHFGFEATYGNSDYQTLTLSGNQYSLTQPGGDVVVEALTCEHNRPVTVTAASGTKVYDGTPLTRTAHGDFTVEGLPVGLTWTAEADGTVTYVAPSPTDDDKPENEVTDFRIFQNEDDVTTCFASNNNIILVDGTLEVTKRPVTITARSAYKPYDGTPLTCNEYINSGLAADDYAAITTAGRQTEIGTSGNVVTKVFIANDNGRVNHCYEITTVNGTLTVTPRVDIGADNWHAVSTPMHDDGEDHWTFGDALATGLYDLFRYDEPTATWENEKSGTFDHMEPARGYLYRSSQSFAIPYNGLFNSEPTFSIDLTTSGTGDLRGFNLVGNPYPFRVKLDRAFYALNPDGSWTLHPNGDSIAAGQGALVYATAPETLTFYASTRSTNAGAKGTLPALPKGLNLNDNENDNSPFSLLTSQFAHWDGDQLIIEGTGLLTAYDALGRELLRQEITESHFSLLTSHFPQAGAYILRLNEKSQKIVIK